MPFAGEPPADQADLVGLVVGYLDFYAAATLRKLSGLSHKDVTRSCVPSGWSPLGMVKHSAATKRFWIRHVFEGDQVDFSWPGSPELEWAVTESDTVERITEFYTGEHRHAVAVIRSWPPETVARRDFGTGVRPTMGWISLHLLQESARHCGHLDVSRELADGTVDTD